MDFSRTGYNALFKQWLQEWRDDAAEKNSKLQHSFTSALKSLKKYPLPVYSGHGCQHLSFFGDFTCKKLEKKLASYLKENKLTRCAGADPLVLPTTGEAAQVLAEAKKKPASRATKSPRKHSPVKKKPIAALQVDGETSSPKSKRKNPAKKQLSNASSADLVVVESTDTLSDLPVLSKSTLSVRRSVSDSDICLPSTSRSSGSTASVSVGRTAAMNFSTMSRPTAVLTLGGGGGFVARTASSDAIEAGRANTVQSLTSKFGNLPFDEFTLPPGSFDVVLCVDNQEIHGKGGLRSKMDIITELQKQKVQFEVRNLKAGDFLWIAKEKMINATGRTCRELVLDFIAERKRGDDLAVSIKDGRYSCQKFRLKSSTLRRIIYIIEDRSRFAEKGLNEQALQQALANMEVQDGFMVKETANLRDTGHYLQTMTQYLQRHYSTKTLRSCSYTKRCEEGAEVNIGLPMHNLLSFSTFSAVTKTNQARTVSQAFLLQLMALDGVSPAKASAIVQHYPTIRNLIGAYDNCATEVEKQQLLRDIRFGTGLSTVGPTVSKKLCMLYCTNTAFI